MRKQTNSSFRRARRNTEKKRQRIPKKHNRETTNSMEGRKNLKKHARKRSCLTGRIQKRVRQWHALRRQGSWPDIRLEQKTIPKKCRKKKFRKGIASSRQQTLLGDVAVGKKKAPRGHAPKGQGTWPGMQQDF